MHISEGILSPEIAIVGYSLTTIAVVYGMKKLEDTQIIKIAILTSLFFTLSLIHIPIGATNIHLMLIGVIGVILGFYSFIAITIALLIQAFLLGYGGLTSLGVNSFNISMGAVSAFYMYKIFKDKIDNNTLYFLVGFVSSAVSLVLLSFSLFFSSEDFLTTIKILFVSNIGLLVAEGVVTIFIFKFLTKFKIKVFDVV